MAGRIRLRGSALAWKRCSPGNDATVHGPVSIGSTESIPCSKVARAQLVTHGVRSLPAGVRALGWDCRGHLIVLPIPLFIRGDNRARPKVLTHVKPV